MGDLPQQAVVPMPAGEVQAAARVVRQARVCGNKGSSQRHWHTTASARPWRRPKARPRAIASAVIRVAAQLQWQNTAELMRPIFKYTTRLGMWLHEPASLCMSRLGRLRVVALPWKLARPRQELQRNFGAHMCLLE